MSVQTGQQQGNQNDGGAAADQGGTGPEGQNLLDGEAAHQQANQQQGSGAGDDGAAGAAADGGTNGPVDVAAITAQITAALEAKFDSIADRRVNALLKAQNKANQGAADDKGGQQQQAQEPSGPSPADVREARSEYRESVSDEITFLGADERSLASDLAGAMIATRLTAGEDPASAGIAVAKDVGVRVKALRKHYEDRTVAALRRKGLLAPDGRGDGQVLPGAANPGGVSGFKAGADVAARMFPSRTSST